MRVYATVTALLVVMLIQTAIFASGSPVIGGSHEVTRHKRGSSRLQAKFNAAISNLQVEFDNKLRAMESKLARALSVCDVYYKNVCYWSEVHADEDIDFEEARAICRFRDSHVADIVDRPHYELLVEKLRTKIPYEDSFITFWLGLEQRPRSGVVKLSNGLSAPYLKWYPDHEPDRAATDTNIVLKVRKSSSSANQGMYDRSPTTSYRGVICQYALH